MNIDSGLERCLTFINCHLHPANAVAGPPPVGHWRAVTISRQAGSGAHAVAETLAMHLQAHDQEHNGENRPWTVFDRNLVETVLHDHHLPARLSKFMPEDRVSQISDALDEICGLHPPSASLVDKMAETILRLAELGNVILIGRGAHIVTSRLNYVFHVRLVGSLEKRAEHIQKTQRLDRKAALSFIHHEDMGRRRYLSKYYGKDIDDPLLYHMAINTDLIGHAQAAKIIAESMFTTRRSSDRSTSTHEVSHAT